jgi:hypothetical protein
MLRGSQASSRSNRTFAHGRQPRESSIPTGWSRMWSLTRHWRLHMKTQTTTLFSPTSTRTRSVTKRATTKMTRPPSRIKPMRSTSATPMLAALRRQTTQQSLTRRSGTPAQTHRQTHLQTQTSVSTKVCVSFHSHTFRRSYHK